MDDNKPERIGSDDPAQSVPAAQRISPSRQRSNGITKTAAKRLENAQKTETTGASLTKYDVCTNPPQKENSNLTASRSAGAE